MVRQAMSTWERSSEPEVEVYHPNRSDPAILATRAAVVALLLASIVLMLVITVGGWDALAGMKVVDILYMLVYLLLVGQAVRWSRGSLPVCAALAIILAILAAVAAPTWFNRDAPGFSSTALSASTLGILCLILIPVQILLIAFATRGFQQGWNVEEERPLRRDGRDFVDPRPRPA